MKIHSSSLNSTVGLNRKIGEHNGVQYNAENKLSVAKDAPDKKVNQPSTPEEIKKTLDNVGLSIDLTSQHNFIKLTDLRTQRALSAYNQEFNAPLRDQRAQLITGIDAYA
ncbi:hypothetical protein ABXJ76_09055 [Methylobacter sp. G7]|uniref:hypothetical protein n=1 Tax=Methylobacter sp. G7 TaxID=3230117 RepID=UPI003D809B42